MQFAKTDYEKLSASLETSEELLHAIERVTGSDFEMDECGHFTINPAYQFWENGVEDTPGATVYDLLAALPTEDSGSPIDEGTEVFWGAEGKLAEFDGEKWIKDEKF